MAAFTHLNPLGSRFSDGSWGVYYAADSLDTAVAEVTYHRSLFLARTAEEAIDIDLRWLHADLMDKLHDLRGQGASMPHVYNPDHYGPSQDLGRTLRSQGSAGIVFESMRRPQGQCVAVFKPRALSNARTAGHISLHWDGRAISHWFEKGAPHAMWSGQPSCHGHEPARAGRRRHGRTIAKRNGSSQRLGSASRTPLGQMRHLLCRDIAGRS